MKRKTLLQMYHNLKESASTSDFPYLLSNVMYKKLIARFNTFPSNWKQFTLQGDLADFKTNDRIVLSEAPDPGKILEHGPYADFKISEDKYSIALDTWGNQFEVTRKMIINDDLNGMMRVSDLMGRAQARKMAKLILEPLKGGVNAYDGNPLFALRSGVEANYIANTALANTAAGMAAVQACMTKIRRAKDPHSGELMGLTPKILLTGSTLFPVAQQLIKSTQILPVSTSGGGMYNTIASLTPVEEPLIDEILGTTWWAVLADPLDCPVIEVGFLNGKVTPDLLVKKAEMYRVNGGGDDQFGYEFDTITYKSRHDYAVALGMYQGICRGSS